MTLSTFRRRLATCFVITVAVCLRSLSDLFTVPDYDPWTSFASVHRFFNVIRIVQAEVATDSYHPHEDLQNIQIAWWGMLVVSMIYVVLSFVIGEECRDVFRWIKEQAGKIPKRKIKMPRELLLPV